MGSTETTRVRILIVDDHPAIRLGVCAMVGDVPDFEVVGEAESGLEAIQKTLMLRPDVVLLDNRLPGCTGVQVTRRLRAAAPGVRMILLTAYEDTEEVQAAIEAGASGYLTKRAGLEELEQAVRTVHRGERLISAELWTPVLEQFQQLARQQSLREAGLSPDEIQVLRLMAQGATNREIGARCHWSEVTIKRRAREIYRKLDVQDKVQAVAEAFRRGLV